MNYRTIDEWSFESAVREDGMCPPDTVSYLRPIMQFAAYRDLERLEVEYASGSGFALMAAIRKCANHDIVMPPWLAKGFIARYDLVLNCKVGSWDDAFGRPYPKGSNLNALRKRRQLKLAVLNAGKALLAEYPGTPIDRAFYERIGSEFHIGATLAQNYYADAKRSMGYKTDRKVRVKPGSKAPSLKPKYR